MDSSNPPGRAVGRVQQSRAHRRAHRLGATHDRRAPALERVQISVAIQTHPARPLLAKRLLAALTPRPARAWQRDHPLIEIVSDPDPHGPRNPWRCAREAWLRTPTDCTHRLVIQDDALPCPRFLHHARLALRARPDRIVSFYLGESCVQTYRDMLVASQRCAAWVPGSGPWVPAIALAIPERYCQSLAEFNDGTQPIADDEVYGRWTREHRLPWWATIPSLVDHDDDAPSLMRVPGTPGRRVAACYVGDADPSLIDWSRD